MTLFDGHSLRRHALTIVRAALDAASAVRLLDRALEDPAIAPASDAGGLSIVAAGKAAGPMARRFAVWAGDRLTSGVVSAVPRPPGALGLGGPARPTPPSALGGIAWYHGGHPVPTWESVEAGTQALDLARTMRPDATLVVLLSGGASALLAVPIEDLPLAEKVSATRALLAAGVDIHGLNTVRKHLSRIKGGWLAAATEARVWTVAISDIVSPVADDPAVIGSGPTVGDPTRFEDALRVIDGVTGFPSAARRVLERGHRGELPETPKPGDPRLAKATYHVIGNRQDALRGAKEAAIALGFDVAILPDVITGAARAAATSYWPHVQTAVERLRRPACVLSAGETVVCVTGKGRGGRNQELALSLVEVLGGESASIVLASVGTDGIDGPTDAAGALVGVDSLAAARAAGLPEPRRFLDDNDSYAFFDALGGLIRTGPTDTNVGDLQIALFG